MNAPIENNRQLNPKQAVIKSRIMWAALLGGTVAFAVVVAVLINKPDSNNIVNNDSLNILFIMSIVLPILTIPIGLFARGQVFKRNWQGDVITPQGYVTGNVIAWACCEAPIFFSLIVCLMARTFWPYVIPAGVGWLVMLLLWPNGRAMFSHNADNDNPYRQP